MSDFEKLINASDLIEWIMETYPDWCEGAVRSIVDHVENMPSEQPEIIRCKDCKFSDEFDGAVWLCRRSKESFRVLAIDTCNYAKRKADNE